MTINDYIVMGLLFSKTMILFLAATGDFGFRTKGGTCIKLGSVEPSENKTLLFQFPSQSVSEPFMKLEL
jgi:hypothetical protein